MLLFFKMRKKKIDQVYGRKTLKHSMSLPTYIDRHWSWPQRACKKENIWTFFFLKWSLFLYSRQFISFLYFFVAYLFFLSAAFYIDVDKPRDVLKPSLFKRIINQRDSILIWYLIYAIWNLFVLNILKSKLFSIFL